MIILWLKMMKYLILFNFCKIINSGFHGREHSVVFDFKNHKWLESKVRERRKAGGDSQHEAIWKRGQHSPQAQMGITWTSSDSFWWGNSPGITRTTNEVLQHKKHSKFAQMSWMTCKHWLISHAATWHRRPDNIQQSPGADYCFCCGFGETIWKSKTEPVSLSLHSCHSSLIV
jgi:hypothetical protein